MHEDAREAPRVGSLFSGIGGLDRGLAQAGFSHVFLCEKDGWRRDVLRARFPGVPIYDDVRVVGVEPAPRAQADGRIPEPDGAGRLHPDAVLDLIAGGTPCQDLSVAGQRRGLAGDRSGLFHEYVRVVDALRPRWVLWENVPGAFSSNGGRDFGTVLGSLADIGYGLAWRLLDSRYFGVPQRRRRVFVVGTLIDGDPRAAAERAGRVLAVGTRCPGHPAARGEAREEPAVASLSGLGNGGPDDNDGQAGRLVAETVRSHPRPGSNSNGNLVAPALIRRYGKGTDSDATDALIVADTLTSGSHPGSNMPGRRREDDTNLVTAFSHTQGLDAQPSSEAWPTLRSEGGGHAVGVGASVRRLTPTECERLQGLPDGWTLPGPDSRRYAGLGDAVTATVGEWIGRRILAAT